MKSQRSFHSSPSQTEDKSRVHLPRINDGRLSTDDNEYYENPFYVPPDEEIFKLKNKEKELKEEERKRNQSLKIWEKGIKHGSEGKLRKIMELTHLEEDELQDEKDGKLNIVEAAKSAIKNRVRHKEPLLNFLNKKREMFLFQMSINEKKEQIKEFEELAHLQEISLQNAKDLLEKDAETFKQHVEKNKNETRQAIKNAEDETKEKQKKIQEMKQLQEDLSTVMSKNTKHLEKLEKLYNYKLFLDKLTPEEFLKHQRKSNDDKYSSPDRKTMDKKEKAKEDFKWQIYNINLSPGILELLNDDKDNFEMYFKKPDQLQEFFENLEEKNLFIIKYTQDIEQNLEDLKHKFEIKKTELGNSERSLRKNKQELERSIQNKKKNIVQLSHVTNDRFTEKTYGHLEAAIKMIYEDNGKILKEGKGDQQVSGFDILRLMERKLESQLKELKTFYPQKVLEQYKVCVAKRREEANELNKKKIEEETKDRLEKIKKRLMAQKRFGRPIMARSMLMKDDQEEQVEDEEDIEEIERKKFFTVRFQ